MTYFYFNKKHIIALVICIITVGFAYSQTPENDSLCRAIMLEINAGCNGITNGDNTGATAEDGEPLPECFLEGPNSVWYSFIAPASGSITITTSSEVTGSNSDTEIALYELQGDDCTQMDSLVELGCSQDIDLDAGNFLSTIPDASVSPGQMYYVQVSGWDGTEGSFCLELKEISGPENDSICKAKELMLDVACEDFLENNEGATLEESEPIPGCFSPENNATVWYSFTGPESGLVSLTTEFANPRPNALDDTEVALYWSSDGSCDFDKLVLISCSQDDGLDQNLLFHTNIFAAPAPTGEKFFVQVSGWAGATGSFCIEVNALPALEPPISTNDSICNAIELAIGESCMIGDNTNTLFQIGEPYPGCFITPTLLSPTLRSVWYKFVAPPSGSIQIRTDGGDIAEVSLQNTALALYQLENDDCTNLQNLNLIDCARDGGNLPLEDNAVISNSDLVGGETYYVQVSGENQEGTFCIELIEVIDNDDICDAKEITLNVPCEDFVESNEGAGLQEGEPIPGCFSDENNATVWYTFTGPESGFVSVSTEFLNPNSSALTDTEIALYWASSDTCTFDNLVLIACSQDDGLLRNPDLRFLSNIPIAPATAGERFYVQVSGWEGSTGTFCLEVNEVPVPEPAVSTNDSICNAIDLVVGGACTLGDNTNALFEIGEPYPGCFRAGLRSPTMRSVWYKFVAPASGFVSISTDVGDTSEISLRNTAIALYQLENDECSNPQNLTQLSCSRGGGAEPLEENAVLFSESLISGETYYIQVTGEGEVGTFCIQVEERLRPENDLPCNALQLPIDGVPREFNNFLASVDSGEESIVPPLGDCEGIGNWCQTDTIITTVWFKFVAPASGSVEINTCHEISNPAFDPRIALYSVGDCSDYSTYTLLSANDDDASCNLDQLAFMARIPPVTCLTPGETYYIMVEGFPNVDAGGTINSAGNFALSISEIPITLTSSIDEAYCPDGSGSLIDISVEGGISPYAYEWDNGAQTEDLSDLPAGIYQVVVTDVCGSSDTLASTIIGTSSSLQVNPGIDQAICIGEEVILGGMPTADGGLAYFPERGFGLDVTNENFSRFNLNSSDSVVIISDEGVDNFYSGGDFGPDGFYALDNDNEVLVKFDIITGNQRVIGDLNTLPGHTWTSLAWDASSSQMFAISTTGELSTLFQADLNSGNMEIVANLQNLPAAIWLAINNDGDAYAMDVSTDSMYQVNLNNGGTSVLGGIGFNANFAQDADFDPTNNLLYLSAYNDDNDRAELRVAILATGSTVNVSDLGDPTTSLFSAFGISSQLFTGSYNYEWTPSSSLLNNTEANPIAMPEQAETYYLSVTDACGTTISDSVSVDVSNMTIAVTSTTDDGTGNGTASVAVENGIEPYSYQWSNGDTTSTINGIMAGEYTVTVLDAAGCEITDSTSIFITSIGDLNSAGLTQFEIFPNPNNGKFLLKVGLSELSNVNTMLYDGKGQVIFRKDFGKILSVENEIQLPRIAEGIYLLQLLTNKGSVYKRLIIH